MVCLEMPFRWGLCHVETSQLICFSKWLTGYYVVRVLTGRYFRTDYNTTERFQAGKLPLWH